MQGKRRSVLIGLGGMVGHLVGGGGASRATPPETQDAGVRRGRPLHFPRDHGAHTGTRIEWWYLTGHLSPPGGALRWGFQLTFFRFATGFGGEQPGRLVPRQLLFAHVALTDLAQRSHRHDQRLQRWNGRDQPPLAHAGLHDTALALAGWRLWREAAGYRASLDSPGADFALDLRLDTTQALLLQGEQGFSRKGPQPEQASHYYSQPQLDVSGWLRPQRQQAAQPVSGRAWLDHEWADQMLPPQAQGWDWLGINLFDGGALTCFQLRGTAADEVVWAGGSHRAPGQPLRVFDDPQALRWTALRHWRSPHSGASYPVAWAIRTPVGRFELRALLDAQELDSRASTGTVYWEGLAELLDERGQRLGLGYLEMTGRAGRPWL